MNSPHVWPNVARITLMFCADAAEYATLLDAIASSRTPVWTDEKLDALEAQAWGVQEAHIEAMSLKGAGEIRSRYPLVAEYVDFLLSKSQD